MNAVFESRHPPQFPELQKIAADLPRRQEPPMRALTEAVQQVPVLFTGHDVRTLGLEREDIKSCGESLQAVSS